MIRFKNGLEEFDKEEANPGWVHKYERFRQYIDGVVASMGFESPPLTRFVVTSTYARFAYPLGRFLPLDRSIEADAEYFV